MAAAARTRKLVTTRAGALASAFLHQGDDGTPVLPWDDLEALLRSLVAELHEWAAALAARARAALAVALPVAALVALAVVFCCCCGYFAAGGGRRRRGPDGEDTYAGDGPVVRYGGRGRGGYKGGIFSLHPNKPIL